MSIAELRTRYLKLEPLDPAGEGVCDEIEAVLNVHLPADLRAISSFYSGGILGGIPHHAIATAGPAENLVRETVRLRQSINLPLHFIVLGEPSESLVLMNLHEGGKVYWIDATDAAGLERGVGLRNPQSWANYAAFFEYLLECEEEERL